jgi:hypothetical protein
LISVALSIFSAPLELQKQLSNTCFLQHATFACFQFILEASHLTDGFTWIIQAVRSKLMLAMLQCARQATEVIDELTITMVKVLMSFSVSHCLENSRASIARSRYCVLEVAASKDDDFWRIRPLFRSLVAERLTVTVIEDIRRAARHRRCVFLPYNRLSLT